MEDKEEEHTAGRQKPDAEEGDCRAVKGSSSPPAQQPLPPPPPPPAAVSLSLCAS